MLRLLRYVAYVLVSRKIIQGTRSAFGDNGIVSQLTGAAKLKLRTELRKAILGIAGAALLAIGTFYFIFHTAAEWDQNGYLTFNAQKTVSIALMLIGLFLAYPSRRVLRKPKPREFRKAQAESMPYHPLPLSEQVPSDRAIQIQNFFNMLNKEASRFLEETTRPQNARPRPPTNERTLV